MLFTFCTNVTRHAKIETIKKILNQKNAWTCTCKQPLHTPENQLNPVTPTEERWPGKNKEVNKDDWNLVCAADRNKPIDTTKKAVTSKQNKWIQFQCHHHHNQSEFLLCNNTALFTLEQTASQQKMTLREKRMMAANIKWTHFDRSIPKGCKITTYKRRNDKKFQYYMYNGRRYTSLKRVRNASRAAEQQTANRVQATAEQQTANSSSNNSNSNSSNDSDENE